MKYIYYIIVMVIGFSIFAAYGMFKPQVKISKPVLSINDRIISEAEFQEMLKRQTYHMSHERFVESVIDKQLLIQEAIKIDINNEESFRLSVENFYEQSLINILLNRKLDSLIVDVTNDEITKYEQLIQNKLFLTKMIYKDLKDARSKTNERIEKLEADFIDLSDDLKFIVLNIDIGEYSKAKITDFGSFVYRLDDIQKLKKSTINQSKKFDIKKVSPFYPG